jgi:hypothetical protein
VASSKPPGRRWFIFTVAIWVAGLVVFAVLRGRFWIAAALLTIGCFSQVLFGEWDVRRRSQGQSQPPWRRP